MTTRKKPILAPTSSKEAILIKALLDDSERGLAKLEDSQHKRNMVQSNKLEAKGYEVLRDYNGPGSLGTKNYETIDQLIDFCQKYRDDYKSTNPLLDILTKLYDHLIKNTAEDFCLKHNLELEIELEDWVIMSQMVFRRLITGDVQNTIKVFQDEDPDNRSIELDTNLSNKKVPKKKKRAEAGFTHNIMTP